MRVVFRNADTYEIMRELEMDVIPRVGDLVGFDGPAMKVKTVSWWPMDELEEGEVTSAAHVHILLGR